MAEKNRHSEVILITRLYIDLAMTILLLIAFADTITHTLIHEIVGTSLFALFIFHNIINIKWYKNSFKGTYNFKRTLTVATNLLLLTAMSATIISGFMQSRFVLAFLHLEGSMLLRQVHTTSAYWALIFMSIHTGLHWKMIADKFHLYGSAWRIVALLFVAFGVWASFDREMFSKLFLGNSFDFWSPERPVILFFAEYLGIMGVYVFAASSLTASLSKRS